MSNKQKVILLSLFGFVVLEIVFFVIMGIDSDGRIADDMDQNQPVDMNEATTTDPGGIPEMSTSVPENAEETEAKKSIGKVTESGEETGTQTGIYEVTGSESGYSPSELVVTKGDTVQLEFSAEGGEFDLSIPAYGVNVSAASGESSQVSFNASASGTFRIECNKSCPDSGKIFGRLIVKENDSSN